MLTCIILHNLHFSLLIPLSCNNIATITIWFKASFLINLIYQRVFLKPSFHCFFLQTIFISLRILMITRFISFYFSLYTKRSFEHFKITFVFIKNKAACYLIHLIFVFLRIIGNNWVNKRCYYCFYHLNLLHFAFYFTFKM